MRSMSALRRAIADLAEQFADSVLTAVRSASFGDLAALTGPTSAPRPGAPKPATSVSTATLTPKLPRTRKGARRSKADQQKIVDAVVTALATKKDGMRSEDIQKALGLSKKDVTRPLQLALTTKAIKKQGTKRATRYFLA